MSQLMTLDLLVQVKVESLEVSRDREQHPVPLETLNEHGKLLRLLADDLDVEALSARLHARRATLRQTAERSRARRLQQPRLWVALARSLHCAVDIVSVHAEERAEPAAGRRAKLILREGRVRDWRGAVYEVAAQDCGPGQLCVFLLALRALAAHEVVEVRLVASAYGVVLGELLLVVRARTGVGLGARLCVRRLRDW